MSKRLVLSTCIVIVLGIIAAPAALAETIVMAVQSCRTDILQPDTNRHDSSKLTMRSDDSAAKSWLKFDINELGFGSVGAATLTVTLHQEKDGDRHFDVSYVNDDCRDNIDWDERSLTWNNAPGNDIDSLGGLDPDKTTFLTTVNFTDGVPGDSFTFDVLDAFKNDTDGVVQFVFHNSNGYMNLSTHDHAEEAWRPYLTLTEGAVPADGATDVPRDAVLSWLADGNDVTYDVYLATDFNDVNEATVDNPLDVLVSMGQEETTYTPDELLEYNQTYYWRIDENNNADPNSPVKGDILSFTVANFLVVDDFEAYNDIPEDLEGSNLVYYTWIDGYFNPLSNGSTMGYFEAFQPTMEAGIVHGGSQSAPVFYDNSTASISEVTANPGDLAIGRNWTVDSPETLTLWFYGDPNNAVTEQMYVKLNNAKVVYDGDAGDIAIPSWTQWDIELSSFGIDLGSVTGITIGFERTGLTGGMGMVLIDDIRLYRPEAE
jgi:hypothetical protein